jgi:hypothetical protein
MGIDCSIAGFVWSERGNKGTTPEEHLDVCGTIHFARASAAIDA